MKKTGMLMLSLLLMLLLAVSACAEGDTLCLDGYTIVYGEGCGAMVTESVAALAEKLGLPTAADTAEASALEILVGPTNRAESAQIGEGLGQYDYRGAVVNGKLILTGGSDVAVLNAVAALIHDEAALAADADGHLSVAADYAVAFDGADTREDYINDPTLFLTSWALEFETPDWMLDFDEKLAAFSDHGGRMMSVHHRSNWANYPENSLEGVISSMLMGADCVEVDLRVTKDQVVVLMHDDTLFRTTDWSSKAGKNGLPKSMYLKDWTYDELSQLRLQGPNGKATEYQIPTFREVLQVCKGRTTLFLDKGEAWSWDNNVYPVIQEVGAWQTCIIGSPTGAGKGRERADDIEARSGLKPVLMFGGFTTQNAAQWLQRLEEYGTTDYDPVLMWSDMNGNGLAKAVNKVGDALEQLKGKVRFWVFIQASTGGRDYLNIWQELYDAGVSIMVTDKGLDMQQYIAATFSPAETAD